jgi:hypothetical protein
VTVTPNTKLSKVTGNVIDGGEEVWEINPLTVAYVGSTSLLYLAFRSPDESKSDRIVNLSAFT